MSERAPSVGMAPLVRDSSMCSQRRRASLAQRRPQGSERRAKRRFLNSLRSGGACRDHQVDPGVLRVDPSVDLDLESTRLEQPSRSR